MSYISRYSNIPSLPSIKKLPEKMEALSKYTEKLRSEGYATRDITASEFSLLYAQKKKELIEYKKDQEIIPKLKKQFSNQNYKRTSSRKKIYKLNTY